MAIIVIAACSVPEAVPASVNTEFTTAGPFVLYADHLKTGEYVILHRKGPSGDFIPANNEKDAIFVSAVPNMVLVETKGVFRVSKPATSASVRIGYEEV